MVHSAGACRVIGDILSRVGDKWSMLVVMTLLEGDRHFNELKRAIDGISQQMLSRTLRALERDGLVLRTVHPSVPVRVEYALSDLGRSLSLPVKELGAWAFANRPEIEASRNFFDSRSADS
ncbi:helix-turn-helix domain-containing protein [Novosphingobium sp. PhB57]|uniref:winged helix-turn-helix transcriptional regulator n=1 Tax=Novosphingobium sp. PhB57 TaxID=2485107 RepID=UPI001A9F6482|nr:helix-turn-helix domain-containing protein [Novosphingobium sp. PhB57]